jgi:polyhydroxybutyrate depolymerase
MAPPRTTSLVAFALMAVVAMAACGAGAGAALHQDPPAAPSRSWTTYRPPGLPHGRAPLLVVLHGLGELPRDIETATKLDGEARRDHFIVAYPAGIGRSWDAGTCCGTGVARHVDDVAFVSGMVATLAAGGDIDPQRVYLVGFSNGAMMALELACDRPDVFAGAAMVEGTLTSTCPGHRPLNLLVIHQRDDAVVPFRGTPTPAPSLGATSPFVPVETALAAWLGGERCTAPPTVDPSTLVRPLELDTYRCAGGTHTVLDLLDGGYHVWPAAPDPALDANATVAAFFGLHR